MIRSICLILLAVSTRASAAVEVGNVKASLNLDTVVSGCVQRAVRSGQWKAGPCRDLVDISYKSRKVLSLGIGVLYNADRGNAGFTGLLGTDIGTLGSNTSRGLSWIADVSDSQLLTSVAEIKPPKFLSYLGKITTIYYSASYVPEHTGDILGNYEHGPAVKLDIPFADIKSAATGMVDILKSGL
jgi:hypothetical protein